MQKQTPPTKQPPTEQPPTDQAPGQQRRRGLSFGGWMTSMWIYTLLRVALFLALWGILELVALHGIVALAVAALLSIPLSFVLLAIPRERFAANIERRIDARRGDRAKLDEQLDPESEDD